MRFMSYLKCRLLSLMSVVISVAWMVFAAATSCAQNLVKAVQTVAKKAIPSVVNIEVIEKQSVPNPFPPFENDPFSRYFFRKPGRQDA